jgi:hypothetical protein
LAGATGFVAGTDLAADFMEMRERARRPCSEANIVNTLFQTRLLNRRDPKRTLPSLHKPAKGQWHVRVRLVMRGDIGIAESAQQVFPRPAKIFYQQNLNGTASHPGPLR